MPTRPRLRTELLAMRDEGLAVREKLLQSGQLEAGYHPEMEVVHVRNAARMREILGQYGWPNRLLAGVDGEEAALLIVQHAIGDPELQRLSLKLLEYAAAAGAAPVWQVAYLADRIAYFEGRPQRYGTHFDWDAEGYTSVYNLEDPARVNRLRESVGLGPLEQPSREGQIPIPLQELRNRRTAFASWARQAGWRR